MRADSIHSTLYSQATAGLEVPDWWKRAEGSEDWERGSLYGLAAAYTAIAAVALIQLVRIERRVPEYGWTTQKVFHLLNFVVSLLRALVFGFRLQLQEQHQAIVKLLLNDLPGLLFFTTYTLLVLFWAEIYHQAKSQPTARLRPTFLAANLAIYVIQISLLVLYGVAPADSALEYGARLAGSIFLVLVSLSAAAGFLTYGGRLFVMLQRFPIESRGRKKKLREVGMVTAVCAVCFAVRAVMIELSTFDSGDFALDIMRHPLLNVIYYTSVELLPSALVLFILRKLPPKRAPVYAAQEAEAAPQA